VLLQWPYLSVLNVVFHCCYNSLEGVHGGVQGKFNRINFRQDFYVGGYSNYSLIRERTGVDGGLVGCIRRVEVDGTQYDMRRGEFIGDALHGYDVGQSVCQSVCPSVCSSLSGLLRHTVRRNHYFMHVCVPRTVCPEQGHNYYPIGKGSMCLRPGRLKESQAAKIIHR